MELIFESFLLTSDGGMNIFNLDLKINANFLQTKVTYFLQFELNDYEWDQKNFQPNKNHYSLNNGTLNMTNTVQLPILVTLPYYKGVDHKAVSNIKVDKNPISKCVTDTESKCYIAPENITPRVRVEKFTGFVFDYNMPFQYSIYFENKGLLRTMVRYMGGVQSKKKTSTGEKHDNTPNMIALPYVITTDWYELDKAIVKDKLFYIQNQMKLKN